MSDSIDAAFTKFVQIANEVKSYNATISSESDTRLKVIDRILTEVLGWPLADISTSERAGSGFTDYVLRSGKASRIVLEAKRDGASFGLENRRSGQAYKLNGAVFATDGTKDAIQQTVGYNAYKNAEIGCATNGREWIVFRANRLGDGQDTMEGMAFIFGSLAGIEQNFTTFYDLLSIEAHMDLRYRGLFQEVEGLPIRDLSFLKSLRPPETRHLLPRGEFGGDFDAIMSSFFQRLKGDDDPDIIQKCFVVTSESTAAEQKLSRIAEDVVSKIRDLNVGTGEQLVDLLRTVQAQHRNRFVLLIGNKGAGKSTFLDRFFKFILPADIRSGLVTIRLDLSLSEGDSKSIVKWLNDKLLEAIESAVFNEGSRTWDDFVGAVFFDEYQRWAKVTMKQLYDTDKSQFKIEFGRHIEKIRQERPHDYIKRLLHDIVLSRRKVPCVILDNTDHFTIEFQEAVFQYARSIYEGDLSIFLIPITDKTSWQLSKQGALQSFESEALYLPVPQTDRIIERRIAYLFEKLKIDDEKQRADYFFGRGIRLSIKNINAFAVSLNKIFVETSVTSEWLGALANYDIRRMLELTRDVIGSPHLPLEELLKAHLAGTVGAVQPWRVKNAIIMRKYDIYPMDEHKFVQNVYALSMDVPASPLLGVRILQLLRDAQSRVNEQDRTFVPINVVYDDFNAMGVHARVLTPWLEAMLRTGLIFDYDPTVKTISDSSRVEITSAGKLHLILATTDKDYIAIMKEVTPVRDSETFESLRRLLKSGYTQHWAESMATFIDYLLNEDANYCVVPDHTHFEGQKRLAKRINAIKDRAYSGQPRTVQSA